MVTGTTCLSRLRCRFTWVAAAPAAWALGHRARSTMSENSPPHPMNSSGPFYVVDGCCTACDIPFAEAPGLFEYDSKNHCFVKCQPATKEELNRMMRAAWAAELHCIRYRGRDPEVLRRFGEFGEPQLCDVAPLASVHPVFRNHATFDTTFPQGESITPQELALAFQEYLRSLNRHWLSYEFTPIEVEGVTAAFSFSWYQRNFHAIEFRAVNLPECRWLVRHSPSELVGSRAVSNQVDDWLKHDAKFCKVRWYTAEKWNGSKEWQETPW